jgi:hypothetical protein
MLGYLSLMELEMKAGSASSGANQTGGSPLPSQDDGGVTKQMVVLVRCVARSHRKIALEM